MTSATDVLIGAICSILMLTVIPPQARGDSFSTSRRHYQSFQRHFPHRSYHRHRRHQRYVPYRETYRRHRLGWTRREFRRNLDTHRQSAPPYSGTIVGEQARLYQSGPSVSAHYGADAPIWSETYVAPHQNVHQAQLHIIMASPTGGVSVDERDLGRVEGWQQGRMQLPLSPGRYTVSLRRSGSIYKRQVQVYEGMITVVRAGIR